MTSPRYSPAPSPMVSSPADASVLSGARPVALAMARAPCSSASEPTPMVCMAADTAASSATSTPDLASAPVMALEAARLGAPINQRVAPRVAISTPVTPAALRAPSLMACLASASVSPSAPESIRRAPVSMPRFPKNPPRMAPTAVPIPGSIALPKAPPAAIPPITAAEFGACATNSCKAPCGCSQIAPAMPLIPSTRPGLSGSAAMAWPNACCSLGRLAACSCAFLALASTPA